MDLPGTGDVKQLSRINPHGPRRKRIGSAIYVVAAVLASFMAAIALNPEPSMSKSFVALAVAAALVLPACAQQQASTPGTTGSAAQAQPAAPNPAEFDRQFAQAQEQMRKMQAQMDRMRATQDPQ